jgi:hypothetical protein
MTEPELSEKIIELDIKSTTKLEVIEKGNIFRWTIKFDFYYDTYSPTISNEII